MRRIALTLIPTIWVVGCQNSAPPSTMLAATITTEQRESLSPAVNQLLSDIEAGKAAGAIAENYSEALKEAGQITTRSKATEYIIVLDGTANLNITPASLCVSTKRMD